ncbi:MAG: [Citrate [pro-3S]-lyase] ligase [Candidatus Erwinia impunctatus]|nr:[Citrate [pro-3S]-lyase] ligase [Culicoides impunctatus]
MSRGITFSLLDNRAMSLPMIKALLESCHLTVDQQIDLLVVASDSEEKAIACAGLYHNIVKCVAIAPEYRGNNLTSQLIDQVIQLAADKGIFHLFLYTKPENVAFFNACGFYPLVVISGLVAFMENTPVGINKYCQALEQQRAAEEGRIGGIVMNANPFTLGHQHLVEFASQHCDHVYIFVVSEESSLFSFSDRFRLVKQGTAKYSNVTLLPCSEYIVSQATFPSYFLKEKADVDHAITGIDLLLFRNYIAPALKIKTRFVGTEPFSPITEKYNQGMKYWLSQYNSTMPAIEVIEIERKQQAGTAISATAVRHFLANDQLEKTEALVPETTWKFLKEKFSKKRKEAV